MSIANLLPFTTETINEMISKTFIISSDEGRVFYPEKKIILNRDRTIDGEDWKWRINRGQLYIVDKRDLPIIIFDGMRCKNDSLYFTGESQKTYSKKGKKMPKVMHEYVPLSDKLVKYCVSTHVGYMDACKRMIKSLVKAGIERDDILVVVGGSDVEKFEMISGINHRFVTHNSFEYNALIEVGEGDYEGDYWYLLHDTSEVDTNFKQLTERIDVGLNFDISIAAKYEWGQFAYNIGVYSKEFIDRMTDMGILHGMKNLDKEKAIRVEINAGFEGFVAIADLSQVINGKDNRGRKISGTKDVYSNGVYRDVVWLPDTGIFKYVTNPHIRKASLS